MIYICIGTDKDIDIHNGILSRHKKNEILPFATTWMDTEGLMLNEIHQTETMPYDLT